MARLLWRRILEGFGKNLRSPEVVLDLDRFNFRVEMHARVAELVDASDLGSGVRMDVGVRVPPRAILS